MTKLRYRFIQGAQGTKLACLFLVALVFFSACSTGKSSRDTPVMGRKPLPERGETPPPKPSRPVEPMDTLRWTVIDTLPGKDIPPVERKSDEPKVKPPPPPIQTGKDVARYFKDTYTLALVLPFMAGDSLISPGNRQANWAMDYYLGFKIAFLQDAAAPVRFRLDVLDSRGNDQHIDDLLGSGRLEKADVIVGPYRSQYAARVADFVRDKPIIHFSPYSAGGRIGLGNENYLQVNPGLEAHIAKLFDHLRSQLTETDHVVFLHGDGEAEIQKKEFWDSLTATLPARWQRNMETRRIPAADATLSEVPLDSLLPGDNQHIVVFPSWDETQVHGILRKLAAERMEKRIRVYGLPQWMGFDRLDPAHLEALQVHVTSADYYDPREPEMVQLSSRFREMYGQPLNTDVVWGYRSGRYLAETLIREGALFQRFFPEAPDRNARSEFQFVRVPSGPEGHYRCENRQLIVLHFDRGAFLPVR